MRIRNTASDAAAPLDEVFGELQRSIFAAYNALVDHNRHNWLHCLAQDAGMVTA
jgi:hypothetical protein